MLVSEQREECRLSCSLSCLLPMEFFLSLLLWPWKHCVSHMWDVTNQHLYCKLSLYLPAFANTMVSLCFSHFYFHNPQEPRAFTLHIGNPKDQLPWLLHPDEVWVPVLSVSTKESFALLIHFVLCHRTLVTPQKGWICKCYRFARIL